MRTTVYQVGDRVVPVDLPRQLVCCVEAAELLAPPLHTSVAAASGQLCIDVEGAGVRSDDCP